MVTLDPCGRLNTIYHQLVPTILINAEEDDGTDSRSAIESTIPKLEERTYILAGRCAHSGNCGLCQNEMIEILFQETMDTLEEIWNKENNVIQDFTGFCEPVPMI